MFMARRDFNYIREWGKVNSIPAKRVPGILCILLIGGTEGKKSGEGSATQWFIKRADRGNYLVLVPVELVDKLIGFVIIIEILLVQLPNFLLKVEKQPMIQKL
jgi:hypothetical protein